MTEKSKTNKKVPNLRFPGFEGEWEVKRLGEMMSFKVTNSLSRENLNYENGTVKNIHYGDIHTKFQTLFDITKDKAPFINTNVSLGKISPDNYCKEGDIIFADASEDLNDVGKSIELVSLNNEKLLSGLHTLLVRPKENIFKSGFNGYLFKSKNVRVQIQKEAQGTKVLSISAGRISKIELTFPTLLEQQKIASFLTLIDERIQVQNKIIGQLESLMQGLREKLFRQKIRFKDEKANDFPDWKNMKLGEVAIRITTKNKENNQNVLTISAQSGLISQLEFFNKSVSAKDVSGYYLLNKNDFAYNKSYSKGYPMGAIKRLTNYDKGIVSTLYICFRLNSNVHPIFMEHYFESGIHNNELEKVAQEGARNHGLLNIGLTDFFDINLKLPSFPEQTLISNFISSIYEKINIEKGTLKLLTQQKQYLLLNLFI